MAKRASNSVEGDRGVKGAKGGGDGRKPIAFDDVTLVRRFRQGDMESFSLLVAKYQDRIYNMLLRMCGRAADAEELAQEAFLRAMERIGQFHGRSKFYTWLFRIAANLAISHRRRSGRIKFHSLSGPEDGDSRGGDALTSPTAARRQVGPQEAAVAAETNQRVMIALSELDEEFRLVIVLRDIEEMDYAQVADVMNVPVGTVKSRLHRARAMLRDRLRGLLDDYE
ncbi:MAG: sigma-70 family RNA polymerase sigma factor [Phycisphaerae bacterium]|nr:sigma-70 family RNA polymerase sigma factor [Phycisphaerae bacterium]